MTHMQAKKKLITFLLERDGHRLRRCGRCNAWYVVGVDTNNRVYCGDICKREAELDTKRKWWTKNYGAHNFVEELTDASPH